MTIGSDGEIARHVEREGSGSDSGCRGHEPGRMLSLP